MKFFYNTSPPNHALHSSRARSEVLNWCPCCTLLVTYHGWIDMKKDEYNAQKPIQSRTRRQQQKKRGRPKMQMDLLPQNRAPLSAHDSPSLPILEAALPRLAVSHIHSTHILRRPCAWKAHAPCRSGSSVAWKRSATQSRGGSDSSACSWKVAIVLVVGKTVATRQAACCSGKRLLLWLSPPHRSSSRGCFSAFLLVTCASSLPPNFPPLSSPLLRLPPTPPFLLCARVCLSLWCLRSFGLCGTYAAALRFCRYFT